MKIVVQNIFQTFSYSKLNQNFVNFVEFDTTTVSGLNARAKVAISLNFYTFPL